MDLSDLNPEELREACALACEALAEVTMLGRDTRNAKTVGRIRRGAFHNAALVIRKMTPEDFQCLLESVAASRGADAVTATTKATPNGSAASTGGSCPSTSAGSGQGSSDALGHKPFVGLDWIGSGDA